MVAAAGTRRLTRDERGMASIVAAALVGVLALVGAAGLALGQFALTRQRAATAADLAALAAATQVVRGGTDAEACARAEAVAAPAAARVVSCEVLAPEVVVRVAVPAPPLLARLVGWVRPGAAVVQVQARAGPPR